MSDRRTSPELRYARAVREVQAYRERLAAGTAEEREELLAGREELRDLLEILLDEAGGTAHESGSPPEASPDRIDRYQVLELLGEGGMGTVYLVEQAEPVRRRAALKLLKSGIDSQRVLDRFEAERQALAVMEHNSIAKVFDAGVTRDGRPYFVMEHVAGQPLTEFCDRRRLRTDERLRLFQEVCAAVQHAHQKGVIHRDLKPSNILVTEQEGRAVPKVIDFGIAKATDQGVLQRAMFTEHGQVIGTPEYMSPEQTESADVDTRTDVYSLGVVLYELLVGCLPFATEELRHGGLLEFHRAIREVEALRPSTRLVPDDDASRETAARRGTTEAALSRVLRGDLDWIVMRAIDKDRNRRYGSASELAADVGRHLDHQPVVAGPPSATYRLAKFLRRYRIQAVAGAAVLMALIAGIVGMSVFAMETAEQAQVAEDQRGKAAAKVAEYDLLAGVVKLRDAIASERDLYPAWPALSESMHDWLEDQARPLLRGREQLDEALAKLRERALPESAAEERKAFVEHPRYPELAAAENRRAVLQRAQDIAAGREESVEVRLDPDSLPRRALDLWEHGMRLVKPERAVFGREAEGLAMIQLALERATGAEQGRIRAAIPGALLAAGRDAEALEHTRALLDAAAEDQRASHAKRLRGLEQTIAARPRQIAELEERIASLRADLSKRWRWSFANPAQRFLHDAVTKLRTDLDAFERAQVAAVEERLAWAGELHARSIDSHRARWEQARRAIAAADGASAHELYRNAPLDLAPQVGLVPIGVNPVTRLWEFYHLRSAAPDSQVPAHAADGSIEITADTGIVFVLVPGAKFIMGAQSEDPAAPNHDPDAQPDEFPRAASVAPYFLARHELTQAQWLRLSGSENPSRYPEGVRYSGMKAPVTLVHPVENLSWTTSDALLRRIGLVLPTEAQWEYACRAGTETPWSTGEDPESLADHANLRDEMAARYIRGVPAAPFDDGYIIHAPVGSFRPNAFGLFDVHGNVSEWCLDEYDYFLGIGKAVKRGGSDITPPKHARSAKRITWTRVDSGASDGVRAARRVFSAQ